MLKRNRSPYIIPDSKIEFIHSSGWKIMDICDFFSWIETKELFSLKPVEGRFSILVYQPAFIYRSNDLDFSLSPSEMYRFGSHTLYPRELLKLREYFGQPYPFELGNIFYNT